MTPKAATPLPDFERPPVVEVVCGVTFKSLDEFLAPHLGRLWNRFREDYPKCQEEPPLAAVIERFGEAPETSVKGVSFTNIPPMPRVWFLSEDETRLVQVQRDRFLHNWKKVRETDEYPRYSKVMEMFRDALACFDAFLANESLGSIDVLQYELTYVNHVPLDEGWASLADIGRLFPDFSWRNQEGRFLPAPERNNWSTTFTLPENSGRLHVTIQKAIRVIDHREVIRFDLTARGIGADRSRGAMGQWFDTAREWIVRGFADLTGREVQQEHWSRIS